MSRAPFRAMAWPRGDAQRARAEGRAGVAATVAQHKGRTEMHRPPATGMTEMAV
jgi:hypothetical protein